MNPLAKIVLIAAIAVLIYDTFGALASRTFDFPYTSLMIGSCIIYAGAGFFAGREKGFVVGALVGAIVGLMDATLGWAISWNLDVGRPPEEMMNSPIILIAITIVFVTLLGAGLGFVGAAISSSISK